MRGAEPAGQSTISMRKSAGSQEGHPRVCPAAPSAERAPRQGARHSKGVSTILGQKAQPLAVASLLHPTGWRNIPGKRKEQRLAPELGTAGTAAVPPKTPEQRGADRLRKEGPDKEEEIKLHTEEEIKLDKEEAPATKVSPAHGAKFCK